MPAGFESWLREICRHTQSTGLRQQPGQHTGIKLHTRFEPPLPQRPGPLAGHSHRRVRIVRLTATDQLEKIIDLVQIIRMPAEQPGVDDLQQHGIGFTIPRAAIPTVTAECLGQNFCHQRQRIAFVSRARDRQSA